ncbi:ATP-grasp fold amidoligase family protein [Ruania alba]|uniref:TupA-like ATPgrasp n=1 Tax=Ruania alba TaxID=648782 RepID=A0A1H5NAZ5_9MICO|nr:ATP-grasp fold amidoligase family protein [Ruania alba]SEE98694.1 TupA-like ATPgrasp [Ruania alba]
MFGSSLRQRALGAFILLVGAASAVLAAFGQSSAALVGLVVMVTLILGMQLEARPRQVETRTRVRWIQRAWRRLDRQRHQPAEVAVAHDNDAAAQIRTLEGELASARGETSRLDDLARASYRQSIRQYIRVVRAEHRLREDEKSAALLLPFKLRNLEFAASHGIGVPEVYRAWPDLASMDLHDLPDSFVLKSDGGAGSVGVFPLKRTGGKYRLLGKDEVLSEADLKDRFDELGSRARAPYFAEELLHAADGGPIPLDIKCYMFYGEVGHVLVRRVAEHGDPSTIRLKFVDERGQDFGPVALGRRHNHSIPRPAQLPQVVQAARHLSRAVGLPFCRVDLYETTRGIVLGEITRAPSGGNERFVEAHDELLGRRWIQSEARLQHDLTVGRPYGAIFGSHADLHLYPEAAPSRAAAARRTILDCSHWCVDADRA